MSLKNVVPFLYPLILLSGCMSQLPSGSSDMEVASNEVMLEYREAISEEFLLGQLSAIAHDSLQGRETGMPGQKQAAHYLAGYYNQLGFKPMGDEGYFQYFGLNAEQTDSLVFSIYNVSGRDTALVRHEKAVPGNRPGFLRLAGSNTAHKGEILFAGFGVNDPSRGVHHLEGADFRDNWVLIFDDIPYIANGDTLIDPSITDINRPDSLFEKTGAAGILFISGDSQESFESRSELASTLIQKPRSMRLAYLDTSTRSVPDQKGYLEVSPLLAAELLGLGSVDELEELREETIREISSFEAKELGYQLDYRPYEGTREIRTENVVALLEGADPELRDEVVVLMAHYDHVGITNPDNNGDMINNGADDNGSGTAGLMAAAQALHQAAEAGNRLKRSVLFLHVSAEEKGLLGSRYYSDHPAIPIEQTVTAFNADMIGRSDARNVEAGDTDYVYIIGGNIISSELDSLVHVANDRTVEMRLDYFFNDLQDRNQFYRRSDHWNFGRLGVPFVFFFTGVHEDYHRPSDHIENVDIPKLVRTSRLVYSSTVEVANYDGRPGVDNEEFIEITRNRPR
ncbi:MAG: M20/M25/M40 family metallo-hydrolase [Balneolaceae bacterium]